MLSKPDSHSRVGLFLRKQELLRSQCLEADRSRDLVGFLLAEEPLNEGEAEGGGGAGALRGDDRAIFDNGLCFDDLGEFIADGEVCGVGAVFEQSCVEKCGGRCADGGDDLLFFGVALKKGAKAKILAQNFKGGATWDDDKVEGFVLDVIERAFGNQPDATATGELKVSDAGDRDLGFGAAKEVYRGDRFDFFETFGKNNENALHRENGLRLVG